MNILRILALSSSTLLIAGTFITLAQSPSPDTPTLTMNARTVLVDVVVTGKDGQPVKGLHQEDFNIWEDGHPQQITSFEEHPGAHPPPPLSPLPPNVFTNIPRVSPSGSPIVLLLDSLNTPLADQTFVRKQMLKYLQHLKPGVPMAIFTLGSELRLIQGFTDDPAVLRAVAQNIHSGSGPETSPLLQGKPETNTQQLAVDQIASTPGMGQMAAALQQFLGEQSASQDSVRTLITLDALEKLAHYLGGIPGRKSVIWFSGSFPSYIFPDQSLSNPSAIERGFTEETRKADAALSVAEVAIYPIAAEGVASNALYDVDTQLTGTNAQTIQQQSISNLNKDNNRRNLDQASMGLIAQDTGGKAFINDNGIDKDIATVVQTSSDYYTLSYTPTKPAAGEYRKIKVKLTSGNANLAYRNGYFATDPTPPKPPSPNSDPLHPFMQADAPDSTQIPLALVVQPASPPASAPCPGDNHDLTGPLPCDSVIFVIAAKGLKFNTAPDGSQKESIEVTLLAYNDNGKPLNWLVRSVNLDMNAARYEQVKANGVNFNLTIGIPKGATTLRGGIYDPSSGLAGTLTVPLAKLVTPNLAPSPAKPN